LALQPKIVAATKDHRDKRGEFKGPSCTAGGREEETSGKRKKKLQMCFLHIPYPRKQPFILDAKTAFR